MTNPGTLTPKIKSSSMPRETLCGALTLIFISTSLTICTTLEAGTKKRTKSKIRQLKSGMFGGTGMVLTIFLRLTTRPRTLK